MLNLTGHRFGKLVVLDYAGKYKWNCICDCGNKVVASGYKLRDKRIKSCGCSRSRLIDLVGHRSGKLIVTKYAGDTKWLCLCDCGNTVIVYGGNLRKKRTKSCGCLKSTPKESEIGNRYGSLVVKNYIGRTKWLCICDCGKEVVIPGAELRHSRRSCGCKKRRPYIDETGKRYGKLVVQSYAGDKKWHCVCDCGNTTISHGYSLRIGDSRSCGCLSRGEMVEIGSRYGMLVVKSHAGNYEFNCVCDCGNEVVRKNCDLRNIKWKSCGCQRGKTGGRKLIDLVGNRYGKLVVQSYAGKYKWNCICDCGNKVVRTGVALRSTGIKSCGCHRAIPDKTMPPLQKSILQVVQARIRSLDKRAS